MMAMSELSSTSTACCWVDMFAFMHKGDSRLVDFIGISMLLMEWANSIIYMKQDGMLLEIVMEMPSACSNINKSIKLNKQSP